ncbi:MAG: PQQ-binding-like beta-propeller repeat protein [Bdellovibrionota bacterium]
MNLTFFDMKPSTKHLLLTCVLMMGACAKGPLKQVHQRTYLLDHVSPFSSFSTSFSYLTTDSQQRLYFGTRSGKVICVDSNNGKTLWQHRVDGGSVDTEVLVHEDGSFWVGTSKGYLYKFDHSKGKKPTQLWKTQLIGMPRGKMMESGGKIVVGTNQGFVFLVSENGEIKWKYKHRISGGQMMIRGYAEPSTQNDRLFFANSDGEIVALSMNQGTLLWKRNLEQTGVLRFKDISSLQWLRSDPTLMLVTSYEGNAAVYNRDGDLIHLFKEQGMSSAPWIGEQGDRMIFAGKQSIENIDQESYIPLGNLSLPKGIRWSGWTQAGQTWIGTSVDGWLYVVDQPMQEILWKYHLGRSIAPGVQVLDGKIWVLSSGGHLAAFAQR